MVTSVKKHPALMALEQRFKLGNLSLSTQVGMRWRNRMEASDAYFKDYSNRFGWRENEQMLSDFPAMMKRYGTYVAIPYAVTQNWVADTYYRNPDPLIQDKGGNRDLSRILSDLGKSVHQEVDSERKMKDALLDQSWAGFGCVWASFRQSAYLSETERDLETGEPALVAKKQQILFKRINPWRIRWDPEGRDWDLSDHSYVALLYFRQLGDVMRDTRLSDEDKRRVMTHYLAGSAGENYDAQMVRYATLTSFQEEDPEYIRLPFWHIWARPEKLLYDMPLGAQFTTTPQPWPDEFADEDAFPLRYMAKNREPEDEGGLRGFVGIPDLTMIKPHVYAIMKSEALLLAANQHVINKYLSPKGALDDLAKQQLSDGTKAFSVIEFNKDAYNAFPSQMLDKIKPDDILQLVRQGDMKDLQHLEAIRHEMDMIAQIIGQGPADRGGQSRANTATESYGMQRGLERRRSNAIHTNGKHYNAVTKLFFTILKARQTLPMRYQMTSARFNETVWAEFNADTLSDLDLHFEYATGSSETRTRDEEFALRERMAAILMPVFQARGDVRAMMKVAQDLIEPLNIRGAEQYFNDEAIEIMKQLVAILKSVGDGNVLADDERVAKQIPELISRLAQEMLTQQDLAEVEAAAAGAAAPAPEGEGSLKAAPTPGEADFAAGARGSAAAGMGGGMAN